MGDVLKHVIGEEGRKLGAALRRLTRTLATPAKLEREPERIRELIED